MHLPKQHLFLPQCHFDPVLRIFLIGDVASDADKTRHLPIRIEIRNLDCLKPVWSPIRSGHTLGDPFWLARRKDLPVIFYILRCLFRIRHQFEIILSDDLFASQSETLSRFIVDDHIPAV